ncbi:MAG: hypothetical protein HYU97_10295 [Deltaproteobacteria bacterium]|nr:hypothetical protein [Deltaproteobacteria bacterium]
MAALFIFRVTAGIIFLVLGIFRLQYSGPEAFGFTLFHLASRGALGFFQPVFQQYILPYQREVYYVLVILYLLLGVLFLLGAMVRYAAFLLLVYGALMLVSSFNLGYLYQIMSVACMVLGLGFLINNPGQVLGLDQLRMKKKKPPQLVTE